MTDELPFEGFEELIRAPLEQSDPQSYRRIKRLFVESPDSRNAPVSFLLGRLVGRKVGEREATQQWRRILRHKQDMEAKLGRTTGIQVAVVDFFNLLDSGGATSPSPPAAERNTAGSGSPGDKTLHRVYAPDYHMERLKDEMSRSKRYHHALSVVLLDVDQFHTINQTLSFETGDAVLRTIVKIVRATIRSVDILARYSGDRFLIILPDTNRREGAELAERLRARVAERTARINYLRRGVTATLSAGQWSGESNSVEFLRQLERVLRQGKEQQRDAVYCM